jgi:hypothetical protein
MSSCVAVSVCGSFCLLVCLGGYVRVSLDLGGTCAYLCASVSLCLCASLGVSVSYGGCLCRDLGDCVWVCSLYFVCQVAMGPRKCQLCKRQSRGRSLSGNPLWATPERSE